MKESVEVPAALLGKTREMKTLFDLGDAGVISLKPKPTKRKRAAKKK